MIVTCFSNQSSSMLIRWTILFIVCLLWVLIHHWSLKKVDWDGIICDISVCCIYYMYMYSLICWRKLRAIQHLWKMWITQSLSVKKWKDWCDWNMNSKTPQVLVYYMNIFDAEWFHYISSIKHKWMKSQSTQILKRGLVINWNWW